MKSQTECSKLYISKDVASIPGSNAVELFLQIYLMTWNHSSTPPHLQKDLATARVTKAGTGDVKLV